MKKDAKKMKVGKYMLEVLPSGSLRLRKMYNGETYTLIFDYKPTEKEITQALSAEMNKAQVKKERMTFRTAAENYIEMKRNVLSPTTVREYTRSIDGLSESFSKMKISDITSHDIQKEINRLAKDKSPKTVRNYHGFISAILGTYCPNLIISTTLPQKRKNEPYIPSDEDVKRILAKAKGTEFEIPIMLACFGLRRSEICALTLDDINGNMATINKALVMDENKEWVIKPPKTTDGERTIWLPDELIALINEHGYVYNGHPNSITCYLKKVQTKLGIKHFSIHKLRHYYASTAHAQGVPNKYIMDAGGWKSETVLNSIYEHAMKDKKTEMQQKTGDYLKGIMFK